MHNLVQFMRVIATSTLKYFWEQYPETEQALKSWYQEVVSSDWPNPQSFKKKYRNASILSHKRVVFNICGNKFRLIVDIKYRLKIVFVVWLGTHEEYNLVDAKQIKYVKANKK